MQGMQPPLQLGRGGGGVKNLRKFFAGESEILILLGGGEGGRDGGSRNFEVKIKTA